jgi:hypothetical protein
LKKIVYIKKIPIKIIKLGIKKIAKNKIKMFDHHRFVNKIFHVKTHLKYKLTSKNLVVNGFLCLVVIFPVNAR